MPPAFFEAHSGVTCLSKKLKRDPASVRARFGYARASVTMLNLNQFELRCFLGSAERFESTLATGAPCFVFRKAY